jgi:hypothetical protein
LYLFLSTPRRASQQGRPIFGICNGKLCHCLGHLLCPVALISKMTKLTTPATIDLGLVELAAVLLLSDAAAAGATSAPPLFSNFGLRLGACESWLTVREQQLRLTLPVTTPPL